MYVACLDLEGVLVPEIWISVANATGIEELKLTTRDVPDYDELMTGRLRILHKYGLKLADIQQVIASLRPLDGAVEFLNWLRSQCQVLILSDTFYDFADPLMVQLGRPTLFCHDLVISDGMITGYHLRLQDQKRKAVDALHSLNFMVLAAGDSYNDTSMLLQADAGVLFTPPQNVVDEFPQLPVAKNFQELKLKFELAMAALDAESFQDGQIPSSARN